MTVLENIVNRKTRGAYSTLYARPRQIVVSLIPGDFIEFREAGAKPRFCVPIDGMFRHAIRLKALSDAAEKRKARMAKRKGQ